MTLRRLLDDLRAAILHNRPLPGPGLQLEQTHAGRRLSLDLQGAHVPSTTAAALIPACLTGGGPGPEHLGDLYADGDLHPATNVGVTIRILGLHPEATIPAGTWLLVTPSHDQSYLGQLPLWI